MKEFEDLTVEDKNNLLTEMQKKHGLTSFSESDLKEFYESQNEYIIIVDTGKPFEIGCKNFSELTTELTELKESSYKDDFAYFDVKVLDSNEKDITNTPEIKNLIEV